MIKKLLMIIWQYAMYNYYKNIKIENYPKALEKWYKHCTGQDLDLENPKSYNEKMQWSKLYDNSPLKTMLTDKYRVRDWVADQIGEQYLVSLLGVWDDAKKIDFDALPDRFVLKTNHGSGWNIIVTNKNELDIPMSVKKLNKWLKLNFAYMTGFELQYKDIEPLIIAEEYLENNSGDLNDYKFLCFDGEVKYCWVDIGRYTDHRRNIYDLDWNFQPWTQLFRNADHTIAKPDNFDEMLQIAQVLCKNLSHVRIDLYNVSGKIYFGEITFTNGSGIELIYPQKYAEMLGDMWKLPTGAKELSS